MHEKTGTAHPLRRIMQLGLLALAMGALGTLSANVALAGDGCPEHKRHHKMSDADFQQRMDERMNALREKLALTPEQEPAWNELREVGKQHKGLHKKGKKDKEALAKLSAPERMERMMERMDTHRAHMGEKLEAVKKLYGQLSAEQQATFDAEFMNWRRGGRKGDSAAPATGGTDTQP